MNKCINSAYYDKKMFNESNSIFEYEKSSDTGVNTNDKYEYQ